MIKFVLIIIAVIMLLKKVFDVLGKMIEKYRTSNTDKHFFNVQVAISDKEREIGLMNVKEMPIDCGMLFEYPENVYPSMWMKNTIMTLDALFINGDAQIVHIAHNMKPKSEQPHKCPVICKYVLEINGGLAKKMDIKKGDFIGTSVLPQDITDFMGHKKGKAKGKSKKKSKKSPKKTKKSSKAPRMKLKKIKMMKKRKSSNYL